MNEETEKRKKINSCHNNWPTASACSCCLVLCALGRITKKLAWTSIKTQVQLPRMDVHQHACSTPEKPKLQVQLPKTKLGKKE